MLKEKEKNQMRWLDTIVNDTNAVCVCVRMWKIEANGGLGQRCLIPNSWEEDEREEKFFYVKQFWIFIFT